MSKLSDRTDIPHLEGGWINLTEAAELLGVTRSYVYKLANKPDGLTTLRCIGNQASYVVQAEEIERLRDLRQLAAVNKKRTVAAPEKEPESDLGLEELIASLP